MDPQPYYYESKKPKNENSLFTDLLSIVGQSGNVSKKKQRLKIFIQKMNELEPKSELCELHDIENNFIISRKRYKKELARLKLKIVAMIFVIIIVGRCIAKDVRDVYKTWVPPDEMFPETPVLLIMAGHIFTLYGKMMWLGTVARIFLLEVLFIIQSKLMDLYENFTIMITRKNMIEYPNDVLNQKFKIIDLLLENDPPIWNHQEALDQLNRKYYLLALVPLLMILFIPVTGHISCCITFIISITFEAFVSLFLSFMVILIILISYPVYCFDYDQFCLDIPRIFFVEDSEE